MDGLLPILCLLVGVALPVAGFFLFVRTGMHQLGAPAAYREVSRELGLQADTRGVALSGHLGDRRIWIGRVMVGHGVDRRHEYWGVLDLERPLGLGLLIRPRGMSERIFRRSRNPQLPIGDADLDRTLEARGNDPAKVKNLFTDEVRAALKPMKGRWAPVVTDRTVRVHLRKPLTSASKLRALVRGMMDLAQALEDARVHVAPDQDLAVWVSKWRALAESRNLDFEEWLPAMSGSVDGRRIVVTPNRAPDGALSADVRLFFRPHREIGLRLRPQVEPDGYWSVGQDIQVGDKDFDDAFVIKGYDPAVISGVLSETARKALLVLISWGPVVVDDRALHLTGGPIETPQLGRVLDTMFEAAEGLGW